MREKRVALAAAIAMLGLAGMAAAADIPVGNLVDYTGRTAVVGTPYGQAKVDAAKWVNAHGGINGKTVNLETVDYSYEVPRAIATYKKWNQAASSPSRAGAPVTPKRWSTSSPRTRSPTSPPPTRRT